MLKAFCRVAPSLRFNTLAMFAAGLFFLARDFKVRSWLGVHARRFDTFLAIQITSGFQQRPLCSCEFLQKKAQNAVARSLEVDHVSLSKR
jgi:hypothetical protein